MHAGEGGSGEVVMRWVCVTRDDEREGGMCINDLYEVAPGG